MCVSDSVSLCLCVSLSLFGVRVSLSLLCVCLSLLCVCLSSVCLSPSLLCVSLPLFCVSLSLSSASLSLLRLSLFCVSLSASLSVSFFLSFFAYWLSHEEARCHAMNSTLLLREVLNHAPFPETRRALPQLALAHLHDHRRHHNSVGELRRRDFHSLP